MLSPQCAVREAMNRISTLSDALFLQQEVEKLLDASGQSNMHTLIAALYSDMSHQHSRIPISEEEKKSTLEHLLQAPAAIATSKQALDHYLKSISHNDDKLLAIDLCRMLASKDSFSPALAKKVGHLSLSHYRALTQAALSIQHVLQPYAKEWFHEIDFQQWREQHFKEHLKEKRKEEREKKRYARPYTEYLDLKEKELFKAFWDANRWAMTYFFLQGDDGAAPHLLPYIERMATLSSSFSALEQKADLLKSILAGLSREDQLAFLKTMRSFNEMDQPLCGRYRSVRNTKGIQLEKHLAAAFYPLTGFGYGRSQAFRQSTPQGSVFKVVVAYQALLERYQALREINSQIADINPLTLIDDMKWHPKPGSNEQILGYTLDGQTITRQYKGSKLPRGHPTRFGKIDIVGAFENSSNIYFSILAAEHIQNPLNLIYASRQLGFGEKSGIELPGEIPQDA